LVPTIDRVFHWRRTIPNGLQALAELGPLSFSNLAAGGQNRSAPSSPKRTLSEQPLE